MGKKSSRYEPYAPCDSRCHFGKCDNPEHTIHFPSFRNFVSKNMNTYDRRVQFNDMKRTKHFQDWVKSKKNKGLYCFYCYKDLSTETYHVDHYMPLKHKGRNNINNFRISCPKCNMRKGTKIPSDAF